MPIKYLFIAGLGRTGSKLVLNILRLSPGLTVVSAGETKYMGTLLAPGFRDKIRKEIAAGGPDCLQRVADLCIHEAPNQVVWNDLRTGVISRQRLLEELKTVELSDKGVFECALRLRAESATDDEILLVDKTPQNLYYVKTLLDWFPQATVIHTIRDPRAVLASAWTRRMKEYPERVYFSVPLPRPIYSVMIVFHVSLTWLYAVYLDRRYRARHPGNYMLVKFEDVVSNPETTIRDMVSQLGIGYSGAMVDPPSKGSSFATKSGSGIDTDTLSRWRKVLRPWMILVVKVICGRSMTKLGYS